MNTAIAPVVTLAIVQEKYMALMASIVALDVKAEPVPAEFTRLAWQYKKQIKAMVKAQK